MLSSCHGQSARRAVLLGAADLGVARSAGDPRVPGRVRALPLQFRGLDGVELRPRAEAPALRRGHERGHHELSGASGAHRVARHQAFIHRRPTLRAWPAGDDAEGGAAARPAALAVLAHAAGRFACPSRTHRPPQQRRCRAGMACRAGVPPARWRSALPPALVGCARVRACPRLDGLGAGGGGACRGGSGVRHRLRVFAVLCRIDGAALFRIRFLPRRPARDRRVRRVRNHADSGRSRVLAARPGPRSPAGRVRAPGSCWR